MKKQAIIFTLAASLLFASCGNVWTGGSLKSSGTNFDGAEEVASSSIGTSSSGFESAKHAAFILGNVADHSVFYAGGDTVRLEIIGKAGASSEITLSVNSYARLDESTFAGSFKFFNLANSSSELFYPERKTQLDSKILDVSFTTSDGSASSANVTTTIDFSVDTEEVSKNVIALLIDATSLKDIHGRFVVNGNKNEKCGEESDSLVRYIGIASTADDSLPTSLSFLKGEDFAPEPEYKAAFEVTLVPTAPGKITPVSGKPDYLDYSEETPKLKQKKDLAELLKSMYSIQMMNVGESFWTTSAALDFVYDSDTITYRAQELSFAPGTKYRLVKKVPAMENSNSEEENSKLLYGHKAFQNYTDSYTVYGEEKTATYFGAEPAFIVINGEYANGNYSYASITAAQNSIITLSEKGEGRYTADLGIMNGDELEFSENSFADFIVTDSNYNKIPCTVTRKDKNSVIIQLENHFYKGKVLIWVGNGTQIKKNPFDDTEAVCFGLWKDSDYGTASGYVKLFEN